MFSPVGYYSPAFKSDPIGKKIPNLITLIGSVIEGA
jgi:hypothetical protein